MCVRLLLLLAFILNGYLMICFVKHIKSHYLWIQLARIFLGAGDRDDISVFQRNNGLFCITIAIMLCCACTSDIENMIV